MHRLLFWWLRMKILPRDFSMHSGNDSVCYILSKRSISDLLVLEQVCRKKSIPRPRVKPLLLANSSGNASFFYLETRGKENRSMLYLEGMIEALRQTPQKEIKIIPVSIFWGRSPGHRENSFWRVFFSDAENVNPLKKISIILVRGRDILVNFGKPISLQEFVQEKASSEQLKRKLNRVLRVHFRTQKNSALGPILYHRQHLIEFLLKSNKVAQEINTEAKRTNTPVSKVTRKARKNLETICADFSPRFILLFYIVLTWLFRKIFNAIEIRRSPLLTEVARTHELIYLPSHRSHIDYLLLSYVLYKEGLMTPHIGSGDNLNIWLVGSLLRKAGAFFLKRSFRGNRLYTTLFSEYMHYLVSKGYPLCFFLEGGRSRTGLLREPKTGMLSMIANSYLRDNYRKISLVPVYIGYDRVIEAKSLLGETNGKKIPNESIWGLIKARKIIGSSFGKVYVSIGKPQSLDSFLVGKDKHFNTIIANMAQTIMEKIADNTMVTPVSLLATILLAKEQRLISVDEFFRIYRVLQHLSSRLAWSTETSFPKLEASTLLKIVDSLQQIEHFSNQEGEVIYLKTRDDPTLIYAARNMTTVFLIPAIIAKQVEKAQSITIQKLQDEAIKTYHLLRKEFFLKLDDDTPKVIQQTIDEMSALALLTTKQDGSLSPSSDKHNATTLHNIANFFPKI